MIFLSTPSARRATNWRLFRTADKRISIHALREEGDQELHTHRRAKKDFYPRPPRGGRRYGVSGFQAHNNFYPRPPRGGRRSWFAFTSPAVSFLSTPSARRATGRYSSLIMSPALFLSTPSARRATRLGQLQHGYPAFLSTPSARRATCGRPCRHDKPYHFYPRPPRGGRQI